MNKAWVAVKARSLGFPWKCGAEIPGHALSLCGLKAGCQRSSLLVEKPLTRENVWTVLDLNQWPLACEAPQDQVEATPGQAEVSGGVHRRPGRHAPVG